MKKMRITVAFMIMSFAVGGLVGCGAESKITDDDKWVAIDEDNTENINTENDEAGTEEKGTETRGNTEPSIFSELKNCEFYFSSGAGGWDTRLTIQPDGSFSGLYHDSEAGESGEGYPDGTIYLCSFHGVFTEPVVKNDYTYQFGIESIQYDQEAGTEEIINGVRYVYCDAYGVEGTKEFYLYLPEAQLADLPQEYKEWTGHFDEIDGKTALGMYGLYNVTAKEGFSSYSAGADEETIDAELAEVEAESQLMDERLRKGDLSQSEMNQLSREMFQLWDTELNSLWSRLSETLDGDAMEQLTEEEREWIRRKEQEVEAAGKEAEGGSLQPLLENDKAAELTRERVYELAEILKGA